MNHGELKGYSGSKIWVSQVVENISKTSPLSPFPTSLFTIGLIPYLLTAAFVFLAGRANTLSFLVAQGLAATIAFVGPGLIWHFDEHVFPEFARQVTDVVKDHSKLLSIIEHYEQFSCKKYWIVALPWTGLILIVLIVNIGFFQSLGVTGYADPAFLIYLVFASWWSLLTGMGLHGVVTAILCVRAVGDLNLQIDPLHYDGLGGLSTIGYFSIRATLMNSIGSLALPIGFTIAARGSSQALVYTAVAVYIGFILVSFIYPTYYVNRRAQEVRDRILRKKRDQIRQLEQSVSVSSQEGTLANLETQLMIRTLREDYHEYRNVNLYPLSISILVRLASSVFLPILFTVLETYVFTS